MYIYISVKGEKNMEKNRKEMKIIAQVIYWFARVANILVLVGVIGALTGAIIGPILLSKVGEVTNNTIEFNNEVIEYTLTESKIEFDKVEIGATDYNYIALKEIRDLFKDSSTFGRIAFLEGLIILGIICMLITYITLRFVTKLFKNIANGDTPFMKENAILLKKIGKYMLILTIMPLILQIFIVTVFGIEQVSIFRGIDIIYILVIFSLAYIFEYGYQLQEDVDGII